MNYFPLVIAGIAASIVIGIIIAIELDNDNSSNVVQLAPSQAYSVSQYVNTNVFDQIGISICSSPSKVPLFASLKSSNGTTLFSQSLSYMPYYKLINTTEGYFSISITNVGNQSAVVNAALAPGFMNPQHIPMMVPPYTCRIP